MRKKPYIFEVYPDLEAYIPWISLGEFPTPVQRLDRISEKFNAEIWIKRDDLSSRFYGGNKVRKLEFILADALARGKKYILTYGGIGSNHALATTIHARRVGLRSIIVLVYQPITRHVWRNLLLDRYFGAEMYYAVNIAGAILTTLWCYIKHRGIYFLPPGGSSPIGTLGYVDAAFELKRQVDDGLIKEPSAIFVAQGSGGTFAGLILGVKLAGLKSKVFGVRVTTKLFANKRSIRNLCNKTLRLLRSCDSHVPEIKIRDEEINIIHEFYGGEYGRPTKEGIEALRLMRRLEGIKLDLTYTAKTFAALLAKKTIVKDKEPLLFWNTFNSVDFAHILKRFHDYHALPKSFWRFFGKKLDIEELGV